LDSIDSRECLFQNNYPWYYKLLNIYIKLLELKKQNTEKSLNEYNTLKNKICQIDASFKWIELKSKIREYRTMLYEKHLVDDTIYGGINCDSLFYPEYYQLTYDFKKLEILEWYYRNLNL
jgi:hypothetical protein